MNIRRLNLILGVILLLLMVGVGCISLTPLPKPSEPVISTTSSKPVFCTQEAKQCSDGSYVGRTGPNCQFADCPTAPPTISSEGKTCTRSNDTSCGSGYECIQKCGPPVVRVGDPAPGYYCELNAVAKKPRMCPICLASNTFIDTPIGSINVTKITTGTRVWSLNEHGEKILATVIKIARTSVPKTHRVIHLVLADKREVWVSPNHPTITGQAVGALRIGDKYDESLITQINLVPYWDDATYDILPNSFTGDYLANGIWLGSTLNP